MSWIAAGTVAAGAISANAQSDASSDAAAAQGNAAGDASFVQNRNAEQVRRDNQPFMQTGLGGNALLATLLGMSPATNKGGESWEQIRARLQPQFANGPAGNGIDDKKLDAATNAEYARMGGGSGTVGGDPNNPLYGFLTKRFTGANVASDPGYQFGLDQGMLGMSRTQAARGGLFSGNALKAGTRYAQDYAGTKFGEAWNRDAQEKGNLLNTALGAMGRGQAAIGQVGYAGMNAANQIGQNMLGAGNAQAANSLNQGNIWANGVNQLGAYANQRWGNRTPSPSQGGFQSPAWWSGGDGWEGE
jgi:hypothetical protein